MGYILDPICLSTEGAITSQTTIQDFALSTAGTVCFPVVVGGGDPEGAWERIRRNYERTRRPGQRQVEVAAVEDQARNLSLDMAEVNQAIEDMDLRRAELEADEVLLRLEVNELARNARQRDVEQEQARRENVIFLAAVRAQREHAELLEHLEEARRLRVRLANEVAAMLAVMAIFFP